MVKILIGGSPCTFWSIAQKNNRETKASGVGWELFRNYLIAKERFKPNFFLYENNKSASQTIKNQIKVELGVREDTFCSTGTEARYIEINSALVSAQNRQRFYVHNCGQVELPQDRGIFLCDILEDGESVAKLSKISPALTAKHSEVLNINPSGRGMNGAVIHINGKSRCLTTNKGEGQKIIVPVLNDGKNGTATKNIYEVKNGLITIKGQQHHIKMPDGFYTIRKLSPVECERLQTLPDGYTKAISNSRRYKGLGNGWTAEIIIHILNGALKRVSRDEEIVVLSMYDGIGTGRYCLDKMGFTNVKYYAYEIDDYAMRVANDNYPDIIQCGDAFQMRDNTFNINGLLSGVIV